MQPDELFATIVLPSLIAGVLFLVFTYLYQQSRAAYFRAWQLGWACYCAAYLLILWNESGHGTPFTYWCAGVVFAMVPLFILASTEMFGTNEFPLRWKDVGLLLLFMAWAANDVYRSGGRMQTVFVKVGGLQVPIGIYVGMSAILLLCAWRFWRRGRQTRSLPLRVLGVAVGFWVALLVAAIYYHSFEKALAGRTHLLGPIPQVLMGIAMVMVLYENERRTVQETLLGFSSLEAPASSILEAPELEPAMRRMLERLMAPVEASHAFLWITDAWRRTLPPVGHGFSDDFFAELGRQKGCEYLLEMLGGKDRVVAPNLEALADSDFENVRGSELRQILLRERLHGFALLSLRTRESLFGFVFIGHRRTAPGSSQLRLLGAGARQLSMTLENHVLMQDAARRTQEFELLTEIGQVVSSRLDSGEVLRTVHRELSRLFEVENFYAAFMDGDEVHFELEVIAGELVAKRTRKVTRGFTEHIIRTGEPLLVQSNLEKVREELNTVVTGPPAKCFCGVPIFMYGRAVGVMAALSYTREFVYEQRDLDVMKTAAGQVAVAMENARLFAEEQRRSKYLEILNKVSKTAISSQEPEVMMNEIVGEIESNFGFDHVGIGILDYGTKDIEIKAEAGTVERTLGRRIPLGVGILGRVARSGEMALSQGASEGRLLGVLPQAKSVLCVPIAYGETLLGVLNAESLKENAFRSQEVLILRTLGDLLATALHNAFVFQKMQQQSITDGLTGIKTRRYFNEALASEWKRASRSGRPFSVVLIDLDKFKNVNDSMGHLEGDLVLARIARILEQKSRHSNVVARYGGDEFVILMPETAVDQAQILSERLRLWIATDTMLNERQITGSFGLAAYPVHGATAEEILRVADMGMYNSKRSGGNRVSTPEDFGHAEAVSPLAQSVNHQLESMLRRAELGPEAMEELLISLNRLVSAPVSPEVVLEAIRTINHAAEAREVAGARHGEIVGEYAEVIGRELGMAPDELRDLGQAARLHDAGKILVPDFILNKEAPLSEAERRTIEQHPLLGAQMLAVVPGASRVAEMVRHHHEHFDGNGYPDHLRGEDIPLGSRIIGVAEAYAHITADRPYAAKRSPTLAMAELEQLSGTQFDGMVVRMFLGHLRRTKAAAGSATP